VNSSTIFATIATAPIPRYLQDGSQLAEFSVSFPNPRTPEQPNIVEAIAFGKMGEAICKQDLQIGTQIILESRISMNVVERSEGFKEKKAQLNVTRYFVINGSITAPLIETATPVVETKTPATPVAVLATANAKSTAAIAPPSGDYVPDYYDDIPF
jgi:single-strand DNA-binding protein